MKDDPLEFSLDPESHTEALKIQRNQALDEGARWRAVAVQERQTVIRLLARVEAMEQDVNNSQKGEPA